MGAVRAGSVRTWEHQSHQSFPHRRPRGGTASHPAAPASGGGGSEGWGRRPGQAGGRSVTHAAAGNSWPRPASRGRGYGRSATPRSGPAMRRRGIRPASLPSPSGGGGEGHCAPCQACQGCSAPEPGGEGGSGSACIWEMGVGGAHCCACCPSAPGPGTTLPWSPQGRPAVSEPTQLPSPAFNVQEALAIGWQILPRIQTLPLEKRTRAMLRALRPALHGED